MTDSIDIAIYCLVGIMVLLVAGLMYKLILLYYRDHHDGYKMIYRCRLYDFTEQIENAICKDSPYKGMEVYKDFDYLAYYSTVDDPIIKEVYNILSTKKFMTKRGFMTFVLRFVQMNVRYAADTRFGVADRWSFPVNTLIAGCGDCEDSSFLFQSIIFQHQIEQATIIIKDHATTGVSMFSLGTRTYHINGEKYKQAETTDTSWFGMKFGKAEILYSAIPMTPKSDFKDRLVVMV